MKEIDWDVTLEGLDFDELESLLKSNVISWQERRNIKIFIIPILIQSAVAIIVALETMNMITMPINQSKEGGK